MTKSNTDKKNTNAFKRSARISVRACCLVNPGPASPPYQQFSPPTNYQMAPPSTPIESPPTSPVALQRFSPEHLLNTPKLTPPPLTSPPPALSQPSKHNSPLAINLDPIELIFSTPPISLTLPVNAAKAKAPQDHKRQLGNPQYALQDQGIFDSGCSKHMIRIKTYLTDYQDIDGGFVAFSGSTKRGGVDLFASKLLKMTILVLLVRRESNTKLLVRPSLCDNGSELKNNDMNQFCGMKGIKREFNVARTPQQNGVAERKNKTLIEAARTMLADSLLPTTFWAEAVNTACYVQNRVLVTKPHNKTPYELLLGQAGQEKASDHEYILLPLMLSNSPLSSSSQSTDNKDADEAELDNSLVQQKEGYANNTNTEISQSSGPIHLVADETVYRMERQNRKGSTTASSLKQAGQCEHKIGPNPWQHLMNLFLRELIQVLANCFCKATLRMETWKSYYNRMGNQEPTEDKERELWVELKRLFEPDDDDTLWKLQRYTHDPLKWKLYDTCVVHHVSTERGHDIFMLVEKDYPLTIALMTLMLSNKLQVDEYSVMADELLRKIFILATNQDSKVFGSILSAHMV
ncbi:retrovirus-related pol polyprotein from transposon TNT 1-94 [Tanacetum coccineum]